MNYPLLQDTEHYSDEMLDTYNYIPLAPDGWNCECGNHLYTASDWDINYWGRGTVRVQMNNGIVPTWPIKIYVTGREPQLRRGSYRIRVKIEYLQDGEPSIFDGGWLWLPPS